MKIFKVLMVLSLVGTVAYATTEKGAEVKQKASETMTAAGAAGP